MLEELKPLDISTIDVSTFSFSSRDKSLTLISYENLLYIAWKPVDVPDEPEEPVRVLKLIGTDSTINNNAATFIARELLSGSVSITYDGRGRESKLLNTLADDINNQRVVNSLTVKDINALINHTQRRDETPPNRFNLNFLFVDLANEFSKTKSLGNNQTTISFTPISSLAINLDSISYNNRPLRYPEHGYLLIEDEIERVIQYQDFKLKTLDYLANVHLKEVVENKKALAIYFNNSRYLNMSEPQIVEEYFKAKEREHRSIFNRQSYYAEYQFSNPMIDEKIGFKGTEDSANLNLTLEILKHQDFSILNGKASLERDIACRINGKEFKIGLGGLHYCNNASTYIADDNTIIRYADVSSYYPNIILNNRLEPRNAFNWFHHVYKELVDKRIKAKEQGNIVESNALKLLINSCYGKFSAKNSILNDPRKQVEVVLNGQLYLCMLIEQLEHNGIEVINANTDGIICGFEKVKEPIYNKICKEWSESLNFNLEFEDLRVFASKDVNNYISINTQGKVKNKGVYDTDSIKKLKKAPIISEMIQGALLNNKKIPVNYNDWDKNILKYAFQDNKEGMEIVLGRGQPTSEFSKAWSRAEFNFGESVRFIKINPDINFDFNGNKYTLDPESIDNNIHNEFKLFARYISGNEKKELPLINSNNCMVIKDTTRYSVPTLLSCLDYGYYREEIQNHLRSNLGLNHLELCEDLNILDRYAFYLQGKEPQKGIGLNYEKSSLFQNLLENFGIFPNQESRNYLFDVLTDSSKSAKYISEDTDVNFEKILRNCLYDFEKEKEIKNEKSNNSKTRNSFFGR